MTKQISYIGKRVAIVGCASGMGEACARSLVEMGAEVHGADIRASSVEMASFSELDLKDWNAIDQVVEAIGGRIDALFNCAGLPQTFPGQDVLAVNFLGLRYWTEQWVPKIKEGGAIATISSLAGMRYLSRLDLLKEVMAKGRQEFLDWAAATPETVGDTYSFAKELLNCWTQVLAVELAPRHIRANITMPSPTDTPMIAAFEELAGEERLAMFYGPAGRRSTAQEQADALLLLNSDLAGFINAICLPVDGGFTGGTAVGAFKQPELFKGK
ncbi:3-alpha-hydroxysteroid dehydrogenase [Sphingobium sp. SCG-1]|uniref:coniferyl-alcohol dehydrogenase n=1 Tax=Sphingobium sp. SCG-1 TaxID=2072936 RepID=UPI000CD6C25B|nr:coniferyl-alcohol dehydrogenase [Sphingobium sp. SCG-1]AUW57155.1 3-alpha-hydroxysteroid dehydrogenase [Sphingobium sp. SCG-1]